MFSNYRLEGPTSLKPIWEQSTWFVMRGKPVRKLVLRIEWFPILFVIIVLMFMLFVGAWKLGSYVGNLQVERRREIIEQCQSSSDYYNCRLRVLDQRGWSDPNGLFGP